MEIKQVAHEYSVQIHDWISKKIDLVKQNIKQAEKKNDVGSLKFFDGQLQELNDIRQYLSDKIDLNTQTYYQ